MKLPPESLRGRAIAAVPMPADSSGGLHREGLHALVASLAGSGLGGVAVNTPIGRGPMLDPDRSAEVLSAWREGIAGDQWLVAWAGASEGVRRPLDVFQSARSRADQAARSGADLLLVEPPGAVRGRPDRDRLVLEYHAEVAQAGLPILVSYRREAMGGIAYGPDVLAQLLARPEVLGLEIATLDGIATFQQVEGLAREVAPSKLVISGEERFLGYSLLSGADAAVVGMAGVLLSEVVALMDAYRSGEAPRFLNRLGRVDAAARVIFAGPTEGHPLRLLRALAHRGLIPIEAAHDLRAAGNGPTAPDRMAEALDQLDRDPIRDRWSGDPP